MREDRRRGYRDRYRNQRKIVRENRVRDVTTKEPRRG